MIKIENLLKIRQGKTIGCLTRNKSSSASLLRNKFDVRGNYRHFICRLLIMHDITADSAAIHVRPKLNDIADDVAWFQNEVNTQKSIQ